MTTYDTRERVAICDGNASILEFMGTFDKFMGMRRPFQKGEVRFAMQLYVIHHPANAI
jgi:hypothetical protein